MRVVGITIDPATQSPIVILRDLDGQNILPIWIGILEANAIAVGLEKVKLPRPMTHDLFKNIMDQIGGRLLRIEVVDIKDNTYYAALHLEFGGKTLVIDSRPSDAIAIAIRLDAPILVHDVVIEKALRSEPGSGTVDDKDKWLELLEKMNPEDFSKYKM
jgi:bifunctional DNase/RNase